MEGKSAIYWFRNDLRISDNVGLWEASSHVAQLLPVYCIDPRLFAKTALGFDKTGAFRIRFLQESLVDLKSRLRALGSDLLILVGFPEVLLPELAKRNHAKAIFASKEVTAEELFVEETLEQKLFSEGIQLHLTWQSTLFHLEDLPFSVSHLPNVFTQFRKEVERESTVRKSVYLKNIPSLPSNIHTNPNWEVGTEYLNKRISSELRNDYIGGETAGLARLQTYIWDTDSLRKYKETRNGLLGLNYSSKFSPWLSLGCISPRMIYEEVVKYEAERVKNDSTYWMIFELLWRDYFRFLAKKIGNKLFLLNGIKDTPISVKSDMKLFNKWKNGKTGVPFIDANMIELALTGFMSNRGRQNVASFLVHDLGLDWRWGAAYFESQLIDYDVCSNWGNWLYIAGVGTDPRPNRYFNTETQIQKYDPSGEFVNFWLEKVPNQAGKLSVK